MIQPGVNAPQVSLQGRVQNLILYHIAGSYYLEYRLNRSGQRKHGLLGNL